MNMVSRTSPFEDVVSDGRQADTTKPPGKREREVKKSSAGLGTPRQQKKETQACKAAQDVAELKDYVRRPDN